MPDLHQEFSVLGELQDLIVRIGARLTCFGHIAGTGIHNLGINRAAIPANPDVALVVHGNSVIGIRPVVSFSGAAPMADQISSFIKFENGRRSYAAIRAWRIRVAIFFLEFQRAPAMNDPDVVLGIDGNPDRHSNDPMVRHRFGPHRVHFKHWGLNRGGLDGGLLFQHSGSESERGDEREKGRADTQITLHVCILPDGVAIFLIAAASGLNRSPHPEIAAQVAPSSIHNSNSDDPEFCLSGAICNDYAFGPCPANLPRLVYSLRFSRSCLARLRTLLRLTIFLVTRLFRCFSSRREIA